MAKATLYNNVIDAHIVDQLAPGKFQVFVDRQYIHEVTSPQAFGSLKKDGVTEIPFPQLNTATVDHIVPTDEDGRRRNPLIASLMEKTLEENCRMYGIEFFGKESGKQGIVHIIGPEIGLTHPGTVIVCGDSHTSTHGAFGNIAYGIGTTQVEQVLRAQSLAHKLLKVRRIDVDGTIPQGVEPKDIAINAIRQVGVRNGAGYAHEFGGSALTNLTMEQRMTICNMGVEGNAAATYFNPDQITFDYLKGRERVPKDSAFDRAIKHWISIASGSDAQYDEIVKLDAGRLSPTVTWGTNPGQAVFIDEALPQVDSLPEGDRNSALKAYRYMKFGAGEYMNGKEIDMVFLGSCTNGRITDLINAAAVLKGYQIHPKLKGKVLVVPGSQQVRREAEYLGLDKIFQEAGAEWREAGCSMCLGMNTDRAQGDVLIASTSNRNYEGRQGDVARTVLMSPSMAAYAAINGKIGDVRNHSFNK